MILYIYFYIFKIKIKVCDSTNAYGIPKTGIKKNSVYIWLFTFTRISS